MKQASFPTSFCVSVLRLAIGGLLIASANQSIQAHENSSKGSGPIFATSAADGGRLFVQRSPMLSRSTTITLTIDGQPAGTLVRGETYDKYITPGRHILIVTSSHSGDAWKGTLEVQAGKTYSYTAAYNAGGLVLAAVGSR
jgi:hypothetical protein